LHNNDKVTAVFVEGKYRKPQDNEKLSLTLESFALVLFPRQDKRACLLLFGIGGGGGGCWSAAIINQ